MKRFIYNLLLVTTSMSLLGCGMSTSNVDTVKEGIFYFNDSTDIIINSEAESRSTAISFNYEDIKPYYLSTSEMNEARGMIISFMEPANYQKNQREAFIRKWGKPKNGVEIAESREPYSFDMYHRQYVAYKNKEGEIFIYVTMTTKEFVREMIFNEYTPEPDYLECIHFTNDGGENFVDVTINFSKRIIDIFYVHGRA